MQLFSYGHVYKCENNIKLLSRKKYYIMKDIIIIFLTLWKIEWKILLPRPFM